MDLQSALESFETELGELEAQLADPAIIQDQNRFREVSVRHAELAPIVGLYHELRQALAEAEEAEALLPETQDEEMREYLRTAADEAED